MEFSQDKLKNSQLHRNRDFRDHFLRFRDIRDQVFKKGTLADSRDQVAALYVPLFVNVPRGRTAPTGYLSVGQCTLTTSETTIHSASDLTSLVHSSNS